nr:hypothetical protein [Tanacetum cinerariifolium]
DSNLPYVTVFCCGGAWKLGFCCGRMMKSRWTHLVRNILTVLNEISNYCGMKLLDVIVKYWIIISSSTYPRGMQQSAEDRKNLSEKKKGRGAFAFAPTSVTLLLEYLTFDLLSMIDKHSRGILSKKFPPAAESSAS